MTGDLPRPRKILWTTRKSIATVAICAVMCSAIHRDGPRPGVYISIGGWSIGGWREDRAAHGIDPEGKPTGRTYQLGLWRPWVARTSPRGCLGLQYRDGSVYAVAGDYFDVIW